MSPWEAVTWNIARTGGFTAYILLAISVALGLALSLHWQAPRWPRLINNELHNFVTLLGAIFLGVHILAAWIDPFTRFGWNEVFIPLVSHYRPLWMAFGIIALYLGLAIGLSTWLRPKIGYTWWRRLHVLTLVIYLLATIHGLGMGSDTRTWWGILIYGGSATFIGALLMIRLLEPSTAKGRKHPAIASMVGIATLALAIWTASGPLQTGWSVIANNGQGSGARIALAASHQAQSTTNSKNPYSTPFTASLQGMASQSGPDANGLVSLQLNTQLSGGPGGYLTIVLQGQNSGDDGGGGLAISATQVTMGQSVTTPLYAGHVNNLSDSNNLLMTALLKRPGSNALQLNIDLQISNNNQITGQVQGTPTSGSNTNTDSNQSPNPNPGSM